MKYDECYKLALQKFDLTERPNFPEGIRKWYAYKGGETHIFETENAALKFSPNIEMFLENQKDIDEVYETLVKVEREASGIFHKNLREKYSKIPDSIYNRCYSVACDRAHSGGYDEVSYVLDDMIRFALDIIAFAEADKDESLYSS